MAPLAHVGHWSVWILYGMPVLIVLASILLQLVRGRREGAATELDAGDRGRGVDEAETGQGERDA